MQRTRAIPQLVEGTRKLGEDKAARMSTALKIAKAYTSLYHIALVRTGYIASCMILPAYNYMGLVAFFCPVLLWLICYGIS
jgi:hypothetical protein